MVGADGCAVVDAKVRLATPVGPDRCSAPAAAPRWLTRDVSSLSSAAGTAATSVPRRTRGPGASARRTPTGRPRSRVSRRRSSRARAIVQLPSSSDTARSAYGSRLTPPGLAGRGGPAGPRIEVRPSGAVMTGEGEPPARGAVGDGEARSSRPGRVLGARSGEPTDRPVPDREPVELADLAAGHLSVEDLGYRATRRAGQLAAADRLPADPDHDQRSRQAAEHLVLQGDSGSRRPRSTWLSGTTDRPSMVAASHRALSPSPAVSQAAGSSVGRRGRSARRTSRPRGRPGRRPGRSRTGCDDGR